MTNVPNRKGSVIMENLLEWIIEHWAILVGLSATFYVIFNSVKKFISLPRLAQSEKVRTWLLFAIAEAEKEFGGGHGQMKLGKVYGDFTKTFPSLAKVISFETFKEIVDESLIVLRSQLESEKTKEKIEAEVIYKVGQTQEMKEKGKL